MKIIFLKFFRFLWHLMAMFGVVCLIAGSLYAMKVYRSSQLSPRLFTMKALNKLGFNSSALDELLQPASRYEDFRFQGKFNNATYPRIRYGSENFREQLRLRYQNDKSFKKQVDNLAKGSSVLRKAIAWTCSGDPGFQTAGMKLLAAQNVSTPLEQDGKEGNGWQLALAYDMLRGSRGEISPVFELRLLDYIRKILVILDEDSASLWHARFTLSSAAWLAASVLDNQNETARDLIRQAQAHFLQAVLALEVSEGWPEGYTYWINSRGFIYSLAGLSHLSSVSEQGLNQRIRNTLERVGLWTVHGTEPQGRIALFGDTGPRNDLRYDTQRVIDLIYLATEKSIFKDYSDYLSSKFGTGGYERNYRHWVPLLQGVAQAGELTGKPDLSFLNQRLGLSELFGHESLGQVFMRSDWGPEATFIAYKAGHTMTHHGHYKAGHFSLNKAGEPLAITSGTYGYYFGPHRLNYYLRTISGNSLLIVKPEEKVRPNKFFSDNVADGGQRIVMPTGSAVVSTEDWRRHLGSGRHYEGGEIRIHENSEYYTYIASDLTRAYNSVYFDENSSGGKVEKVTRELVYLRQEDALLIFDQVDSTGENYTKKWLLHSFSRPYSVHERVVKGKDENGISETTDSELIVTGDKSRLVVRRLFPEQAVTRKLGGVDYRYYVEVDGDDSVFDGINMTSGASEKPWFDAGMWRLEVIPAEQRKSDDFLFVLLPRLSSDDMIPEVRSIRGEGFKGGRVGRAAVIFLHKKMDKKGLSVQADRGCRYLLVLGLAPGKTFLVNAGGQEIPVSSSPRGTVFLEFPGGSADEIIRLTAQ